MAGGWTRCWFSSGVPCRAPWATLSPSRELFSPRLTWCNGSSWSQAIIINATAFPFFSGFQTRVQAPASSHQLPPWCQRSSSKQGEGPRGLPGDRGQKESHPGEEDPGEILLEVSSKPVPRLHVSDVRAVRARTTPGAGKRDALGLGSCQVASP